jgi:hypothetical protein
MRDFLSQSLSQFLSQSIVRGALLATVSGAAWIATTQVGCSSTSDEAAPASSATAPAGSQTPDINGSIGMQLTLPGGQQVNTVAWTITGPIGASTVVQSGTVNLANSDTVSFLVGGIPAAAGYLITLVGTSTDGTATCTGSSTFTTTARTTTNVSVVLQCDTQASEAGSAQVNGTIYDCASISSLTASPAETTVGYSVAVAGAATGPAPNAVTYAWSAPSGSFDTPNAAQANFTCTAVGPVTLTLTVTDGSVAEGGACNPALSVETVQVQCDGAPVTDAGPLRPQTLVTSLAAGVLPTVAMINQGTAIGEGSLNGATPALLANAAADPNNTQSIVTTDAGAYLAIGTMPDTAAGFCSYPTDGGAPTRNTYVTGAKFETTVDAGNSDPMYPLAPAYFPLVYTSVNTASDNAFGGKAPILGLFDWRPKDIDESVLVAESDDNGKTWFFMQDVLELNPDYTNPISGGYSATSTNTGCPTALTATNASFTSASGSQADDGWGHASLIQLPGPGNIKTGQFLYLLDRNTNDLPGSTTLSIIDNAPLHVINLSGSSAKFPIWNTNNTNAGNNDIKSITSALSNTPGGADAGNAVTVQSTAGLLNPDGIMAVFPMPAATPAGTAITIMYVQKILNGDDTAPTALPTAQQCTKAPFSGKTNHDISNVRLASTVDGMNFTDLGVVQGLNDPTTVDYNQTRWIAPRGTLLDVNGDGSVWGLYFSGGNCLDGDSDAFHYLGYAESTDKMHWVVYNDINHPIASTNPITTANQLNGATVTVPATTPVMPTQPWFAERLYAPTATQIDSTHLSVTFAGYGVQTPANDLLEYRQIGNVVLTVSKALPVGVPNNINAH